MSGRRHALRLGCPLWLRGDASIDRRYPSLSGVRKTGIAIVGGGLTGALVAHAFASAGVDAAVIEAGHVGRGSTAASSALLLPEPDLELTQLAARYGWHAAKRIWRLGAESVRELVGLIARLRIACRLEHRDAVYYATNAEAADRLRRELCVRTRAGFAAEWLSAGALRRLTGIPGHGAIRSHESAQCDPYRACLGVLRSAAVQGAQIFERSPVRRIDVDRRGVRVHTRRGTVEARYVVVATGYATPDLRPLTGRFRMYRTYVLATERIDAAQRGELGLSDVLLWDTERPYHYARWTSDRRLLLGGGDRLIRPGQRRRQQFATASRELREHFETLMPALASIETELAWEGLFAMTSDSLPYIGPHRRYPHHWFALGYGGNGMTFSALAARLLLERWRGGPSDDQALFDFTRLRRR